MEISSKGIIPSTINDYLKKWTNYLKGKYGQDFVIKPQGVIDNLAVGASASSLDFESIILKLTKEMNPYTSEDTWQDHLYALIGLEREQSSFTIVQRTVQGDANTIAPAGSVLFENQTTKDQFKLIDDCQINEKGLGLGTFKAEEFGSIDLPQDANCKIITAPVNIKGIYYTKGNNIDIGKDYQENSEFREIWLQEQSLAKANTGGGLKKVLLPYCFNSSKNINIRMNRNLKTFEDLPLHTANIVVNSPYDDETIAKVIFNKMIDGGFGLVGDIRQAVIDSEGVTEDVYFSRANKIDIYYKVVVVLEKDIEIENVRTSIENAIKQNTSFSMGESVIANKLIQYVDEINGVEYVKELSVSKDDINWQSLIELKDVELAQVGGIDVSI